MNQKNLVIVIPAYEPDYHLPELIEKLNTFFNEVDIIIVDDGSAKKDIFFTLTQKNVTILTHEVNKGKGAALKTAFRYLKEKGQDSIIVTADSDGQHTPEDIKRIYDFYLKNDEALVLGSRKFENEVPIKSRFGNDVSRYLMAVCLRKKLNDTQTGLRAFSSNLLDFMININGDKFEYEMNMLSEAILYDIKIAELRIDTIYINENKDSHFRPIRDFLRIVFNILKYKTFDISSFLLNIIIYIFLIFTFKRFEIDMNGYYPLISSIISTSFVYIINFLANRIDYKAKYLRENHKSKYGIKRFLFGLGFIIFDNLVILLFMLFIKNEYLLKLVVDIISITCLIILLHTITKKNKIEDN